MKQDLKEQGRFDMQVVYGIMCNNGDGSSSVLWFKNKDIIDVLLDESRDEYNFQRWSGNEGMIQYELKFPDELNLQECGFYFSDDDVVEDEY